MFLANGEEYRGDFRKKALNVARQPGEPGNAMPALLRGWFGPSAGHPGTRHFVILEQVDGRWVLRPDQQIAEDVGAMILPLFANYRVACGAVRYARCRPVRGDPDGSSVPAPVP